MSVSVHVCMNVRESVYMCGSEWALHECECACVREWVLHECVTACEFVYMCESV
jgi:hypothetical protein